MTPVALIVEYQTPDLLALCLASLKKFAPEVTPLAFQGGPGPAYHGVCIEAARNVMRTLHSSADVVILLDTDTVICSPEWWPRLQKMLAEGYEVIGGHRSRGEACQMFDHASPLLHASMLAMTRRLFDRVESFAAEPVDPELGHVVHDTAWQVSRTAVTSWVIPYFPVTRGPLFPGLQVGEYGWADTGTLWSHLWRGTGMPAGAPWRRALRVMRAACGSESAKTMLRAEERKQRWMTRAWEVVNA